MNEEQPISPEKQKQLALWRARFGFQVFSSFALGLLLIIVLMGFGKSLRSALGDHYANETIAEDVDSRDIVGLDPENSQGVVPTQDEVAFESIYRQFNEFIYNNQRAVDAFHKWAGYLMLVLLPLCGLLLFRVGKRYNEHRPMIFLGKLIMVFGFVAVLVSIVSGVLAGRATQMAAEEGSEVVNFLSRSEAQTKALDFHSAEAGMVIGVAVLMVIVGSVMISTRAMKSSAGIGKDAKEA